MTEIIEVIQVALNNLSKNLCNGVRGAMAEKNDIRVDIGLTDADSLKIIVRKEGIGEDLAK